MPRRLLLLLFFIVSGAAQAAMDLFTLRIPAPPGTSQTALLKQALGIELVRLSGEGTLPPAAQALVETPRRFVSRTAFVASEEDGVSPAQMLEVHFSRALLLQAMEQAGLRYWPLPMRPRVVVALIWSAQGQALAVTPDVMQVRPDLDIEPLLYELGLPHVLPRQASDPLFQRPVLSAQLLAGQGDGVDGVVRLYAVDSLRDGPTRVTLDWETLLPSWPDQGAGSLTAPDTLDGVRQALLMLMARWRARYENVADVEGRAVLEVRTDSAARLLAFDEALRAAKPFIVQAQMTTVRKGLAKYDLVYRGTWEALLRTLEHFDSARVQVSDPVEQIITVQLQAQAVEPRSEGTAR